MKNMTWRRVAIILSIVVVAGMTFGVGYAMGAMETAEFLINQVVKIMGYENIYIDISKADLMHYYLRLKGGNS